MLCLAPGRDVQVRVIPQNSRRLQGRVLIVLREFLQAVEGLLIDQVTLLDPALNAGCSTHSGESFFVVEDFDALSVLDGSDTVVDGRDLIAQSRLWRGDIVDFQDAMTASAAAAEREHERCGPREDQETEARYPRQSHRLDEWNALL